MRALIFSFFVLSGFLICALLTRQTPLNAAAIAEFYFRCLKRLLLVFLVVLNATIFGAAIFALPDNYAFVLREVTPAAFFYSNLPRTRALSYFDEVRLQHKMFFVVRFGQKHFVNCNFEDSRNSLLLHTWSLCVEMQFYAIAPLPIAIAMRGIGGGGCRPRSRFALFGALAAFSFSAQTFAHSTDAQHMLLTSRLWQFYVGFIAFYARAAVAPTFNAAASLAPAADVQRLTGEERKARNNQKSLHF